MLEFELKAHVAEITEDTVTLEFAQTQAIFHFSAKGIAQRKLKLKEGQKVKVKITT
jgi:hypothetical protein